MNKQTILNLKTCQQVQEMMNQLEELQSLCISHYEGLAVQEQQETTKLENLMTNTHPVLTEVEWKMIESKGCIPDDESLAMQGQDEATMLESIVSTTTETYAPRLGEIAQRAITPDLILEARDLYARAKASLKDAYINPAKCSMGGFEESEAELYLITEELRAAGHTAACEHCEALQSLMTSVYEGLLMSGRV